MKLTLVFVLLTISCSLCSFAFENTTKPASLYDITGRFIGTVNVNDNLHSVKAITGEQLPHMYKYSTSSGLQSRCYFLVPDELLPPFSFQSEGSFEFEDGTTQNLPMKEFETGGIVTADVNGDSRPDIIFSHYSSGCDSLEDWRPQLWIQTSPGTFIDETDSLIPSIRTSTLEIEAFDVDGDDDIDLFFGGHDCYFLPKVGAQLLINDGTGHFSIAVTGQLPNLGGLQYVSYAKQLDINSDSTMDLVALIFGEGDGLSSVSHLEFWLNDGNGFFTKDTTGRLPDSLGYGYFNLTCADVTNDGYPDIIVGNMQLSLEKGGPALFVNQHDGTFNDETALRLPASDNTIVREIAVADVDHDGDNDIFENGHPFGTFVHQCRLLMNDDSGHFTAMQNSIFDTLRGIFNAARFGAFENDTLPELFLTKVTAGQNQYDVLLANNGSGIFTDSSSLLPQRLDFSVSTALFDHMDDNDLDIIIGNSGVFYDSGGQNALYINRYNSISGVKDHPLPGNITLSQNYPNPFNPGTIIQFSLPSKSFVNLKVFNILGEEVATLVNDVKDAGPNSITWNASDIPAGVYYYRLAVNGITIDIHKAVLMK